MLIARTFVVLLLLTLVVSFSLISCHHDPGHEPPGQEPPAEEPTDTGSACADGAGAEWTNPQGREGKVAVTWFPSSSDPSVMITDVASFNPLIGGFRAPLNEMSSSVIRRLGGNSLIKFCCGNDKVSRGTVVSQGNQKEFPFDASSSSEIISFGSVDLIDARTWVTLRCQPSFDDHTDLPVDFPISVLSICQKPNGDEYELETTFTYQTFSSCKTWKN